MSHPLDDLIDRLAASPLDRSLNSLEGEIGRSIVALRRDASTTLALAPVRLASIGLALALGLSIGGAAATAEIATSRAGGSFSADTALAPSTLLEGAR